MSQFPRQSGASELSSGDEEEISLKDESGNAEELRGKRLEVARRGGWCLEGACVREDAIIGAIFKATLSAKHLVIRISFHPEGPHVVELLTVTPFDR